MNEYASEAFNSMVGMILLFTATSLLYIFIVAKLKRVTKKARRKDKIQKKYNKP